MMNNKFKLIILTILLVLIIVPTFGQSTIYNESKIFTGTNYTYKCEKIVNRITLYNDSNIDIGYAMRYKDSSLVTDMNILSGETIVIDEDTLMSHFDEILLENLTSQQFEQINNFSVGYVGDLLVGIFFNTETGRIIKIEFNFIDGGPWANLPVSVFVNIERRLKNRIRITYNEIGRSFLFGTCSIKVYKIRTPNRVKKNG